MAWPFARKRTPKAEPDAAPLELPWRVEPSPDGGPTRVVVDLREGPVSPDQLRGVDAIRSEDGQIVPILDGPPTGTGDATASHRIVVMNNHPTASTDAADRDEAGDSEPPPPAAPTAPRILKRSSWLDKQGFYEPRVKGIKSTTRQAEALNIAVAAPPTSPRGLIIGQDAETGQAVSHDPFEAYFAGLISSPNVIVIGDVGRGKSSLLKTWAVLRQLLLGRRVVVIDKKLDGKTKEGEYALLARTFGVEPIKFTVNGSGSRINILDRAIHTKNKAEDRPAGQASLLRAVLAEALERRIKPKEGKALRVAHRTALGRAQAAGREALIGDIVDALLEPDPDAAAAARVPVELLVKWGYDAAFELERMIEEDLAGLVDAPTSPNVNLDSQLTVFDVSALPESGPALPIVMSIINTWMMNVLVSQDEQVQTVFVVEEGWHLIEGSFAKVARRNWKLARGLGLCNVVALHHVADVPKDSPAVAMIKEAETVFLYKQANDDDARECVRLFNLPSSAHSLLVDLPVGTPILKIGSETPIIVSHLRSDLEVQLTNTDEAMRGSTAAAAKDEADLNSVEVPA